MSPNIVVVGSINADLTVTVARHPHPGETLLGDGGGITPGGKGANQAVAAARLGSTVAMVGAVGTDTNSEAALALLKDAAVDLTAVTRHPDAVTGLAVITVADGGENTIMVIPGANALVTAQAVAAHRELIAAADIVLLQGEIPADGFSQAVELAQGRVVVNLAPVIEVDRATLLQADPLVVNEHEAALVLAQLGSPDTASTAGPDSAAGAAPEDQLAALLKAGFASAVITLGANGAIVGSASGIEHVASPHVDATDTVGAGDAFTGALCHRLVAGDALTQAACYAARVGAYAVTQSGAQPSYPWAGDPLPGSA